MRLVELLKRIPLYKKPHIFMERGDWVIRDPYMCIDYKFPTIRCMQDFFRNGRA